MAGKNKDLNGAGNPADKESKREGNTKGANKTMDKLIEGAKPEPERLQGGNQGSAKAELKNLNEELIYAAEKKDIQRVKRAIENGADVNAGDGWGITALMVAVLKNDAEIAKLLIEKGADVNARNDVGMTALMAATLRNNVEIAKLLVDNGADVNHRNNDKSTALMWARILEHTEIADLLKKHGAE